MTKVTVYMPLHNHSKYLEKAIGSVLEQKFHDWELIIIDDGSRDNTRDILKKYAGHQKIKIIHQENKGLTVTNNIALRLSAGDYIIRLDGDDYLDENALLVLSNLLDSHPEVGLVYPGWYVITEEGDILETVMRNNIKEAAVFDIPAHGACTMIRKACLQELGGYNEAIHCQDGYDLWIRFIQRYKVYNVNCPLFYYRRHGKNLTNDEKMIFETRSRIKRDFVKNNFPHKPFKVASVIPVRGHSDYYSDRALKKVNGKNLIDYTIEESLKTNLLDRVIVTTNDDAILGHCRKFKGLAKIKRPDELCKMNSGILETLNFVLNELQNDNYQPDALMVLYIHSPLRNVTHIEKAIDTMLIYDVDSVISVRESIHNHYQHESFGLRPLFNRRKLRLERDALYEENGAIYLTKTQHIKNNSYGDKIGHILMRKEESFNIHDEFDFWLVRNILKQRKHL